MKIIDMENDTLKIYQPLVQEPVVGVEITEAQAISTVTSTVWLSPAQARKAARALLKHADKAEGDK